MLKSTNLGDYWQDSSSCGSSFTRIRCISNGSRTEPQIYSVWSKIPRAFSVPGTSCRRLTQFREKSCSVDGSMMFSSRTNTNCNADGRKKTFANESVSEERKELRFSSSLDMEIEIVLPTDKEVESRLLVCTLDTEQNGGSDSSEEELYKNERRSSNMIRQNSVDMTTARSTIHSFCSSQSCHGCGLSFEASDKVVVFESDPYHTQCFACGECGEQVDPTLNFLVLDNGAPLCKACSPACYSCGEKIVYGHLNVLNKDFHEECLTCSKCSKVSNNDY